MTNISPPWQSRSSIYWHVVNHLKTDSCGLTEGGAELPDEIEDGGDSQIGWAAGALEGVFGHQRRLS